MLPEIYSTFRNIQEVMQEYVLYTPKLIRNLRKHFKHTDDFRRVNEIYPNINGKWV